MTVDGRLFHAVAAATRNAGAARSPSDDLLVGGTTSAGELDLRLCLSSIRVTLTFDLLFKIALPVTPEVGNL